VDPTFWPNRSVLVTGCTGLLGSALTAALVEAGAAVAGVVRDRVPRTQFDCLQLDRRIVEVRGCVEDYALLERALNEYEVDTVFHLAAQTIVGTANRNPIGTFDTNIRGTWNLLEACRRSPWVRRIVVASTDKAYGEQRELPYTEEAPLRGEHPYDVSKSCADLLCRAYWRTYETPVCVTRCGNLFGAGDLNFSRIIPGTIRSALRGERPVIRSDGQSKRDYFYVADAVDGYLLLAESLERRRCQGEGFNFSHERPMTVLEICHRVLALMGRGDLEPDVRNQSHGEIRDQYLAAHKARAQLGWHPAHTLDQGLRETIAWYEEYFRDSRRQGHTTAAN
jgi:CDP-glucose 4,6-dehydratase